MKHLCLLILITCLMCKEACSLDLTLTINQERTAAPNVWKVRIVNTTPCVIWNAKTDCTGFQSHIEIDPDVILKQGDVCIVNGGKPFHPQERVLFDYAWDYQFPFKMAEQSVSCD
nr:hypothetical protein [Tanacetum cinerariifolium]GEY98654.1 hypothetical protein [Tanacetum cinerariifolium]